MPLLPFCKKVLHLSTMTADFSFHRLEATFKTKESAFCFKLNPLDFCLSDQFFHQILLVIYFIHLECLYNGTRTTNDARAHMSPTCSGVC